jgi:hypothetical protein
LREGHKLRVFENGVLGMIFGPKGDEVKEEWRKLHNEKLNDLYCSPKFVRVIKSRRIRWAGMWHVWGRGEVHTWFWWGDLRARGKFPRPMRRWEVNIKTDLQELEWGIDWIDLAQDRNRWRVSWKRGNEPSRSIQSGELHD